MNVLVLIKEVPDMKRVKFDSERGVIDRSSASAEINPFDESALQAACDLRDAAAAAGEEVTITALTMGPEKAIRSLREAYARGADRLVLLTDRAFAGADTLATARTLAKGIEALGGFDVILCGEKTVDGDTAQVGSEIAAFLGLASSSYVDGIEYRSAGELGVMVEELGGVRQERAVALPALISVTKNISRLKLPTVARKLESLEATAEKLTFADLEALPGGFPREMTGMKGSATKVSGIDVPPVKERQPKMHRNDLQGFLADVKEAMVEGGVLHG